MNQLQAYTKKITESLDFKTISLLHLHAFLNGTLHLTPDLVAVALPYEVMSLLPQAKREELEWDDEKGAGSLYIFHSAGKALDMRRLAKESGWHKLTAHRGLRGERNLHIVTL